MAALASQGEEGGDEDDDEEDEQVNVSSHKSGGKKSKRIVSGNDMPVEDDGTQDMDMTTIETTPGEYLLLRFYPS